MCWSYVTREYDIVCASNIFWWHLLQPDASIKSNYVAILGRSLRTHLKQTLIISLITQHSEPKKLSQRAGISRTEPQILISWNERSRTLKELAIAVEK